MSNTAIQLKKSGESGNTPADLHHGEVAINYADGKLYYKNDLNQIDYITNQDTFGSVLIGNTLILATSPTDILTVEANSNIKLTPDIARKGYFIDLADSIVLNSNVTAEYVIVNNTLYSGLATRSATPLPNLVAQFTSNATSYIQVNQQNIDEHGTADFVVTADVGDDTDFYIDMGITNSQYAPGSFNGLGTSSKPLDGYLVVQGSTIGQLGGNLIIGTVTSNTAGLSTKIVAGGSDEKNIVAQFSNNSISLNRNVNVSGSLTGPTITYLQSEINVVFNQANAAFNKANTGTGGGGGGGISDYVSIYKIPVGDYGSIADPIMVFGGLGDITRMYDFRVDPLAYDVIPVDLGYLS